MHLQDQHSVFGIAPFFRTCKFGDGYVSDSCSYTTMASDRFFSVCFLGTYRFLTSTFLLGYFRNLDYNSLSGSLDINTLSSLGLLSNRSSYGGLSVLSLINNSISDVIYNVSQLESITTIIRYTQLFND